MTTTVNVTRVARLRKLRTGEADVNLDGNVYQARVRKQHKRIHQRTDWATVGEDQKGDGKETTALTHLLKEGGALVDEDSGKCIMRLDPLMLRQFGEQDQIDTFREGVEVKDGGEGEEGEGGEGWACCARGRARRNSR